MTVLELYDLFAHVSLALDAQGASRFVQQFPVQLLSECPSGGHHDVEGLDARQRSGQDQKQADTRDLLVAYVSKVETARLDQAGRAEDRLRFVLTIEPVKNAEFSVSHSDTTKIQYQLVTTKRPAAARYDA
jgi:hypothetical protein